MHIICRISGIFTYTLRSFNGLFVQARRNVFPYILIPFALGKGNSVEGFGAKAYKTTTTTTKSQHGRDVNDRATSRRRMCLL